MLLLLRVLVLALLFLGANAFKYTTHVSKSEITLGESVTVSWDERCGGVLTSCSDWIAAFPKGGCSQAGPGQNTCYMMNEWKWVSYCHNQQTTFTPEAPGSYEYRILACDCWGCGIPIKDDFVQCPSYPTDGESSAVKVNFIDNIDLAEYSTDAQFALGLAWVMVQGNRDAMAAILKVMPPSSSEENSSEESSSEESSSPSEDTTPSDDGTVDDDESGDYENSLNSRKTMKLQDVADCGVDALKTGLKLLSFVKDVENVFTEFSLDSVKSGLSDFTDLVKDATKTLGECAGDSISHQIMHDLELAGETLLHDLVPVSTVFDLVVGGHNIFIHFSNIYESCKLKNYFAAGYYGAKLLGDVRGIVDVVEAVAYSTPHASLDSPSNTKTDGTSTSARHEVPHVCMLRPLGGTWEPCNCSQPVNPLRRPGTTCRQMLLARAVDSPMSAVEATRSTSSPASNTTSSPIFIGVLSGGCTFVVLCLTMFAWRRFNKGKKSSNLEMQMSSFDGASSREPLLVHA